MELLVTFWGVDILRLIPGVVAIGFDAVDNCWLLAELTIAGDLESAACRRLFTNLSKNLEQYFKLKNLI